MSTNSTANSSTTSSKKSSRRITAAVVAGGLAIAGIATAAITLGAPAASAHTSSASSSSTPGNSTHEHHHHTNPDVLPSQSVKTLQQQLAQLNYYDGPVSGYWNQATTSAIQNLQRSAGLPETGAMNAATQRALDYQLTNGDNQMGGNTNTPASATIKQLQRELGQLNYYEGPVSGHINAGTIHAIEYLQRSAGLPQTGSMNSATQHALSYQLSHGDNQMGGN